MALPWVRLDTGLPDHPKILALIDMKKRNAALVYVMGLAYAGRHETDGFIPKSALPFLHANKADAHALCDVYLWHHADGGWQINDWAEYQPTSDSSNARRAALRESSRKGNCVRHHGPDCGCWAKQ
jgi:hypothetical protein